jgi:flagellar hook assembly protein FlgD
VNIKRFTLHDAHPNPFNPQTVIAFEILEHATVSLRVFDVSGRLVRTVLDGEVVAGGRREVIWDGRDKNSQQVAAGVYFYRLDADGYSETKSMALIK